MKFTTTLIAILGLSTQVLSGPIFERVTPPSTVSKIQGNIDTAKGAVTQDLASTSQAIALSSKDVGAQAELIATINANYKDIASQFKAAGSAITASTTGAATTLTAPDVIALTSAITTAYTFAKDTNGTINSASNGLSSSTQSATAAEEAATIAAVNPFLQPIAWYAAGVREVGGNTGSSEYVAFQNALVALQATIASFAN